MTNTTTTPVVAGGCSNGAISAQCCSAPRSGWRTSTDAYGLDGGVPRGRRHLHPAGRSSSLRRFWQTFRTRAPVCQCLWRRRAKLWIFSREGRLVSRQITRQLIDLRCHQPPSANSTLKATNTRGELPQYADSAGAGGVRQRQGKHETHQHREDDQHQHIACEVQTPTSTTAIKTAAVAELCMGALSRPSSQCRWSRCHELSYSSNSERIRPDARPKPAPGSVRGSQA